MKVTSRFAGGMRFESDMRGHQVVVDVPKEMGGNDAGPMPPELLATALGTCVGIYAVMFCNKHNISPEGMAVETEWEKGADPVRLTQLYVTIHLPAGVPEEKHDAFMKTVEQCMIHSTLCQMPDLSIKLVK